MKEVVVKMKNKHGLHIRPAKKVVEIAMSTDDDIIFENIKGKISEGIDFFGLISLEISVNEDIKIKGPKEQVEEIAEYLKEFSLEEAK